VPAAVIEEAEEEAGAEGTAGAEAEAEGAIEAGLELFARLIKYKRKREPID